MLLWDSSNGLIKRFCRTEISETGIVLKLLHALSLIRVRLMIFSLSRLNLAYSATSEFWKSLSSNFGLLLRPFFTIYRPLFRRLGLRRRLCSLSSIEELIERIFKSLVRVSVSTCSSFERENFYGFLIRRLMSLLMTKVGETGSLSL